MTACCICEDGNAVILAELSLLMFLAERGKFARIAGRGTPTAATAAKVVLERVILLWLLWWLRSCREDSRKVGFWEKKG